MFQGNVFSAVGSWEPSNTSAALVLNTNRCEPSHGQSQPAGICL